MLSEKNWMGLCFSCGVAGRTRKDYLTGREETIEPADLDSLYPSVFEEE